MSGLKQEALPLFLSPKPARRHDLVHHVRQRRSASSSNDDSEILPDAAHLKGQSTAVNENYSRLVLHSDTEIDTKSSQQHSSSSNEEAGSYVNERANKYHGSSSTWTSWTASERALAGSLDQLKAKDLAVHLYNAHHLKCKGKWPDDGEARSQGWKPSRYWTAWPLAPEIVPAVDDGHDWAGADFQEPCLIRHMQGSQSQELQDVLVARVLRKAKKRNSDLGRHDGEAPTELEPLDSTIYAKQESMNDLKPVIMRDDDVATDVLLPSVRHIMTQLDQLLMGLHYARDSYAYQSGLRRTRDLDSARPLTRGPQPKKSCPSTTSLSENDPVREHSSRPKLERSRDRSRSPPRKNPRGRTRTHMTERDWGDVLGVASMTGWDSKTVSKAAHRCGTLFREGIKFRKLEENENDPIEKTFLPGDSYCPDLDSTDNEEIVEEERTSSPAHGGFGNTDDFSWKFYCTVDGCRRSSHGFMDHNSAKRHFRRVHPGLNLPNWSQTTERHELGQTDRPFSTPFSPGDEQERIKIYCPATSCRHYMVYMNGNRGLKVRSGFADYRSFKRHMQKAHPGLEVPESPQVGKYGGESGAEIFGGVHVDGFLQPIKEAPWWTTPKIGRSSSRKVSRSKR